MGGTLNLKYCIAAFARKLLTWCLPVPGNDASFVTVVDDVDFFVHVRLYLNL